MGEASQEKPRSTGRQSSHSKPGWYKLTQTDGGPGQEGLMGSDGYLLGFDVGSSSIKAALVDARTGKLAASAVSPEDGARHRGQAPRLGGAGPRGVVGECRGRLPGATRQGGQRAARRSSGHRHLLPDARPLSWSTARERSCGRRSSGATAGRSRSGEKAFRRIGERGLPLAASELAGQLHRIEARVGEGERAGGVRAGRKVMLPGDYVAFRMTGETRTTLSGLSEGILWDFRRAGSPISCWSVRHPARACSPRSFRPSPCRAS